jgi:hypothetical protein
MKLICLFHPLKIKRKEQKPYKTVLKLLVSWNLKSQPRK